jgi:hypothetical protein
MMPMPTITMSAAAPRHRQLHAGDAIVLPDDAVDLGAQPHVDAVRAMLLLVEARQRLAGDAREHAIERFEHGDLLAELGEDSGRLEPDIAAADHDGAWCILELAIMRSASARVRTVWTPARSWPAQTRRRGAPPVAQIILP